MTGFAKLFSSIVTSTVWQEDSDTCKIWVTLMALADATGYVDATVPGLANIANVPIDKTREAVGKFLSPDPDSRTKTHEGRRIEEVEGGWKLLNYRAYRDRGRKDAEYYRKYRARKAAEEKERTKEKEDTEGEAEAQPKRNHATVADSTPPPKGKRKSQVFKKPTPTEVKTYADSIEYYTLDAEYFVDSYESKGWMVGTNKMKDWRAVVRTWKHRDEKDGKPTGGSQPCTRDLTEEEAESLERECGI